MCEMEETVPTKGFLNFEQKERLQILVRSNDSPRLREHALILLLQNDGKIYEEIATLAVFTGTQYSACGRNDILLASP